MKKPTRPYFTGHNELLMLCSRGRQEIDCTSTGRHGPGHKILQQYASELFLDITIALAGRRFKPLPVEYGDLVATVLDPAGFFERSRDNVHPRTAHAQDS